MIKRKWFSGKSIFRSYQTHGFYGKWFPKMIFSRFKHSLNVSHLHCLKKYILKKIKRMLWPNGLVWNSHATCVFWKKIYIKKLKKKKACMSLMESVHARFFFLSLLISATQVFSPLLSCFHFSSFFFRLYSSQVSNSRLSYSE